MQFQRHNRVVMIRHAQSEWNREGRFTGWADPPLTPAGRAEAIVAGRRLAKQGFRFDRAFSSRLQRARDTANLVLRYSANSLLPVSEDWRLNERHYGDLQGRDKARMTEQVGERQVWRWRRGYADRPPAIAPDAAQHPARLPQWADIPRDQLPNGESLADTRERVMAVWEQDIAPQLAAGRRLLIASHGNTLRALLMGLSGMRVAEVESFEIPTGVPIVAQFDQGQRLLDWHYLGAEGERAA
jgi:2,3-bisphosphoglycerate-dependent phosphoglycerate mutase